MQGYQFLILLWAVLSFVNCDGDAKPGFKIRATKKAFDYASFIGSAILEQEVKKVKIPDYQYKITQGPGNGEAMAKSMRIVQFQEPQLVYNLQKPELFTFGTSGGLAKVYGDWSMWYKVLIRIKGSGHFSVTASDIKFSVTGSIFRDADGRPQVISKGCAISIGVLDVDVTGGFIGWIVNLFSKKIESAVNANIQQLLCAEADKLVNVVANSELRTLPVMIPVAPMLVLDYRLTANPIVSETWIESALKGEISWQGIGQTPFQPVDIPDIPTPADHMVYLWASDYVVNSFLYAIHTHGAAKAVVNKDTVPELAPYLKTACPETDICVGRISSEMGRKYPNASVEILVATSELPKCSISSARIGLMGTLKVDMFAIMPDGSKPEMLRGYVHFDADLHPRINGSRVVANATIPTLDVNVTMSNIGEFSEFALEIAVDLAKPFLVFLANEHLQRGLPIPTIQDIAFVNPHISLVESALQIQTDLKYKLF